MPNVSRQTASESIALDGLEVHLENFEGGYTVCHTPVHHAGARIIELGPTDSLGAAIGVVMANLESGT